MIATRAVDSSELLDRDRVLQRAAAPAADLFRERDAHPAELAHLGHQLVREGLGAIELRRDRRDLADGELANRALE